jgi:hypothetical protein
MDDATFLRQCGIEVDMRWLAEIMSRNEPEDVVANYTTSLLRVANILARTLIVVRKGAVPVLTVITEIAIFLLACACVWTDRPQ